MPAQYQPCWLVGGVADRHIDTFASSPEPNDQQPRLIGFALRSYRTIECGVLSQQIASLFFFLPFLLYPHWYLPPVFHVIRTCLPA